MQCGALEQDLQRLHSSCVCHCLNWKMFQNEVSCFSHVRYGMLERCKELVEAGYDVRQPDKENVTLLHWAAINNRQELVK